MNYSTTYGHNIYDSLDAPVYVWEKVHKTNDVSWLMVNRKRVTKKTRALLTKAWERLYNEFLKEIGVSEHFIDVKEKELEIALLQTELILTGDNTIKTFIEIAQQELEELNRVNTKVDFLDSKMAIEKVFKFQINMRETSIREFYAYLKQVK